MALEEMFIASAIQSCAIIGLFLYFYHTCEGWIWKRLALFGVFAGVYRGLAVEHAGWADIVVHTDLAELTFATVQIMMWVLIALMLWLVLSLFYHFTRSWLSSVKGERYGKVNEIGKGL